MTASYRLRVAPEYARHGDGADLVREGLLFMKIATMTVAAMLALGAAGAAQAATCTAGTGGGGTTYTLDPASASQCQTGNDTNTIDSTSVFFGQTGWILADKNDDATSGDQNITFADAPENGDRSGDWSISNPMGYTNIFITLKAGSGFGAFLLTDLLSGTWATSRDLSHASIYYNGTPAPAPVPLPAESLMLLAGLGTLAAVRRRKSA